MSALTPFILVLALTAGRAAAEPVAHTIAGTGKPGFSGDALAATETQLNNPYGLVVGPNERVYFCDMSNHRIRCISDGKVLTLAGTGQKGYTGDGGPALKAQLNEPYEIRFNRAGEMFFVEMANNIVRKVALDGTISTIAGIAQPGFSGDGGAATRAELKQPHSIQFDTHGDLYICDIGNHRVRKIDMKTGIITTFAGTGERKNPIEGAKFNLSPLNGPRAIDFDREGNMWLALREGNAIYKLDLKAGTIHHIAGTGQQGFTGNGGPAREATLSGPKGISVAPDGNVFFADTESHSIRMIDPRSGNLTLIAGTGERGDGPDGDPLSCKLSRPHGIFVDKSGAVWVGDSENHRIRLVQR
jgi:streptogramin lyase